MPAYSFTAKDLRQILENSNNYDEFVRARPVTAKMPATSFGYRKQRSRSRSRSKSRTRARSVSHSRAHHAQCNCCRSNSNATRKPLPPGLPRPQSAKTRPRSAKVEFSERPRSAQTRPQSAKTQSENSRPNLPKRPSSAQPRMRYTEDFDSKKMDFTGLSNMMRSVTFNPSRKWRSKSPSQDNKKLNKSKTDIILEDLDTKPIKSSPPVDQNQLRKSRSSAYAKFKYPEKYHKTQYNKHLIIEENIPQCLRKFPRYINQPKRHNCSYKPQSGAVSWVTRHNVKSGNLPSYPIIADRKIKSTAVISFDPDQQDTAREIVGVDSSRDSYDDEDERQRNGNFQYVYKSKTSDVVLDMADIDEDNENGNASHAHAHSDTEDDARSLISDRHSHSSDASAERAHSDKNLPRTDSQDDFEKLLSKIAGGDDDGKANSDKASNKSWERPLTPLSDFHDDSDDDEKNRTFKAKKNWSRDTSDAESIAEEIN